MKLQKIIKVLTIIVIVLLVIMFAFRGVLNNSDFVVYDGKVLTYSKTTGIIEGVLFCVLLVYFYVGGYMLTFQPTKPIKKIFGIEASVGSIIIAIVLCITVFTLAFMNISLADRLWSN